jgi:ABC-type sugar transport system permease subunit
MASAILLDPDIVRRDIVVIWIGGVGYGGVETYPGVGFNLRNDIAAANVVYDSGITVWQVPSNVYSQVSVSYAELEEKIGGTSKLADYLISQTVQWNRTYWPEPIESRSLGDSPAVSLMLYPRGGDFRVVPAPRFGQEGHYLPGTYNVVGLQNYLAMPKDPVVIQAVINNIIWTIVTIFFPVVIGLALAMLLNGKVRGKPVIRLIFYTPCVLPLVAIASIWGWLYNPQYGAINSFLRLIGLGSLAQPWLGQDSTALAAVMVPAVWLRVGFPMLLYLAALQGINTDMYEAATVDGATKSQQFWHITMPSLRPAHYIVIALSLIDSFKVFDLIYAMTYGGPGTATQVMGTWMYFNVFQYYQAGYGTAIAVVITVVAIAVSIPYVRSQTKEHAV